MQWLAKWIWPNTGRYYYNTFVLFRKEIKITYGETESFDINIFADSRYKLLINGNVVGYGPIPSDRFHDCYDKYDILPFVEQGVNTIAVIVCYYGNSGSNYIVGRPEFILQGELQKKDGTKELFITDETFKCRIASCWGASTARRSIWKPLSEMFDARLYPKGWEFNGYDDSSWKNAGVLDTAIWHQKGWFGPKDVCNLNYCKNVLYSALRIGRVEFYDDPSVVFAYMLREQTKELDCGTEDLLVDCNHALTLPLLIKNAPDNQCTYVVFDFGQEIVGHIGMEIKAVSGTIIDIVHRETEQKDKLLLSVIESRNWIRYTAVEGIQSWQSFEYDAFRYVQLAIHSTHEPVEILSVWVEEQAFPIRAKGEFECSDPVLNKLWKASVHTAHLCMQDVIPDNPGREQAPWSGDIEYAKMPIYYIAGEYQLTKRSLIQTSYGQMKNGKMRCLWPSGMALQFFTDGLITEGGSEIPHHSIQWVSAVWRHYLYTGDRDVLVKLFPAIKRLISWFKSHENDEGLLYANDEWDDRWDWVDWEGVRNLWVPLNFFYHAMLADAARIAAEIGESEEGAIIGSKAERLKKNLTSNYWSEEYGTFVDCMFEEGGKLKPYISELTLALAINNDIVTGDKIKNLARQLSSGLEDCSPVHKYHPYIAYAKTDNIMKVFEEFRDRWDKMLSINETNTMQEVWNGKSQPNYCMCQSAAAVPGYYLPAFVLGVRPLKPGFEEFIIEPCPGDLTWAKGRVPTPYGFIDVKWENINGRLNMEAVVPEGFVKMDDADGNGHFNKCVIYSKKGI